MFPPRARVLGLVDPIRILVTTFPAYGHLHPMVPLGVSAFAAHDEAEVDVICETKLERFEVVVVIERLELERIGIEIVPTFRRPHVTVAHEDLESRVRT